MSELIKYTCSTCGKEHEEWPAIGFGSPDSYAELSPGDQQNLAELSDDFCVITYPDQTDRFIRGTLTQEVNEHCENLEYGLWVSLSEKSFNDYKENYNNDDHEAGYFGWLCNGVPGYEFIESIPTTVYTRKGHLRPDIVPHKEFDHPFVRDYYNGISKEEAEKRIRQVMGD